ncbi:MAG TPA: xylulokinase [Candidatus Sulfotelmatobacter sp.]|nr:xylulokinase [Candidatus Sulfotelmatobacter sp.]
MTRANRPKETVALFRDFLRIQKLPLDTGTSPANIVRARSHSPEAVIKLFLGIDVGTGGTRALLIDESGRVVASGTHEHQPFASPQDGWAEQDPLDWWLACGAAVKKALQQAHATSDDVACVGFSGQMHGAVLLDATGNVIRPAIIWCDQRTEKQSQELEKSFGLSRIIQLTCNPPLTNFTLTKLLWVRENEPQNWARVLHVMLPKDYIRYRLTGDRAIDMADASGTLMLDVTNRRWSVEILSGAKIPQEWLPPLYESPDVCGKLSKEGAEAVALKVGTPVVAGAGDQAAGAVGMGIVRAGVVSATIGTSGVVFAATDRPALDPQGRLHTFCHAIPGRWHVMGVTQAAGLSLRWFRDQFGAGKDDGRDPYDRLSDEAASVPAGSEGLLWAPYLMGERTPHLDPNVRGALVGLSALHTRAHVIRAIQEGVAFSLKDTFSIFEEMKVPVTKIRLGGGGARSSVWRQIQADVYAHEVELVEAEEGAAYGAAILAAVGARHWNSVDEACDAVVRVAARVAPRADSSKLMQKNYSIYRRVYPALRGINTSDSAHQSA